MGRKKLDIDPEQVERLARIHCTNEEIALALGCSSDTIVRRFAECLEKGRAAGKKCLRRKQFQGAMKGNTALLIWLGKQYLGQSDKAESESRQIVEHEHRVTIDYDAIENQLKRIGAARYPRLAGPVPPNGH